MTGAEAIIQSFLAEGVAQVFGYAGATICPTVEALAKFAPQIGYTLVRTEQNAGHMASGYYRATGKVGVCMVTSGPGATNLVTGIATAYMDSIPLIALTGQVPSHLLGRDIFQEVDISGCVSPFSKHTYLVKNAKDIPRIFKEAFHIATTGRPGPVLIDLPVDIQQQEIGDFLSPPNVQLRSYRPSSKGHAFQIKRVLSAIENAKRPVICAGGGVFLAQARDELQHFATHLTLPVVTTMMGLSLLPTQHPLNMGMVGAHGTPTANRVLARADLLILIGARVGDRAILDPNLIENRMDVIHIDVDPAEIGKNMTAAYPLVGDIKQILCQMLEHIDAQQPPPALDPALFSADPLTTDAPEDISYLANFYSQRQEELQREFPLPHGIHPANFLRLLGKRLQSDACVCVDVGQNQLFSCKYLHLNRDTRFLTSGGLGTMGYALPCAIGHKIGSPQQQTVVICGDGSFQMSFNELSAVLTKGLDIKIILFQNHVLGLVHQIQSSDFTAPTFVDLEGSPDFIKLAAAYGIPAGRIAQESDMPRAIDTLLAHESAAILVVDIDPAIPTGA